MLNMHAGEKQLLCGSPSLRSDCDTGFGARTKASLLNSVAIALLAGCGFAIASPAFAQSAGADDSVDSDAIIVTAQKRSENILDVPVSVSVMDSEKMDRLLAGGQDVNALAAQVPGFYSTSSNGRLAPRFYVRGVGNSAFDANASQPVSMIYDDVVLENVSVRSFPLFDVQSIEFLRGPQGTLFGRNATAGAVKVTSNRPTEEATGHLDISWGRWQTREIDMAVGGRLAEDLTARVSFYHAGRADWIDNLAVGQEEKNAIGGFGEVAGRIQLQWEPGFDTRVLLNTGYHNLYYGNTSPFRAGQFEVGGDVIKRPRDEVALDAINYIEKTIEQYYATLTVDQGVSDGLTLTSVTGYRSLLSNKNVGDVDGGALEGPIYPGNIPSLKPILGDNWSLSTGDSVSDHYQITQEARVASDWEGPFNVLAGVYLYKEDITIDQVNGTSFSNFAPPINAPAPLATQMQKTTSWAVFGSVDYALSEQTALKFGLRYSADKKRHSVAYVDGTSAGTNFPDSPYVTKTNDDALTGDISLTHELSPGLNFYARAATGYKESAVLARENLPTVAKPERIWNYEAGIKSELLDGMLRLNLSAYYYTYDNYQAVLTGGVANNLRIFNLDEAVGKGFEFESQFAPSDYLRLNLGLAYSDTEIHDTETCVAGGAALLDRGAAVCPTNPNQVQVDGGSLPGPRWTANASLYAAQPLGQGEVYFMTDWAYKGRSYDLIPGRPAENFNAPWTKGNASIGYSFGDGAFDVSAFVNNITNLYYAEGALNFFNYEGETLTAQVTDPRTWGVRLRYAF